MSCILVTGATGLVGAAPVTNHSRKVTTSGSPILGVSEETGVLIGASHLNVGEGIEFAGFFMDEARHESG